MTERKRAIEVGTKALESLKEADRLLAGTAWLAPARIGPMGLEQTSNAEGQTDYVTSAIAGWLGQVEHFAVDTYPN